MAGKTSVSEVKINKKAQGAVDGAEKKINGFKRFMKGATAKIKNKDEPSESTIAKAETFVSKMEEDKGGGGGGGFLKGLADGALGVVLGLPLLLQRNNQSKQNEPVDIEKDFEGDEKELKKEVEEEQKIKDEGMKAVEETAETGKEISKQKIDQIKTVKQEQKVEEQKEPPVEDKLQEEEKKEDAEEQVKKEKEIVDDKKEKLEDVTISGETAIKFEEAVEKLKIRLKENITDKKVDPVSAVKSVKPDANKSASKELSDEKKKLALERLSLEKQKKRVIKIHGRDSTEYDEIKAKIETVKEKYKELPKAAKGGIIQGPQSGYPVSLDGTKVDFIGHGTEEVRTKEDGNGAFVIPMDTPHTRKDPTLQQRRDREAQAMGFKKGFSAGGFLKGFSAGGMNPDKVFGAPLLDKDSELYKYSDIDKVHETLDTQGTKYESSEELARTTVGTGGGPLKVERKSSLMTPMEQYEFLVENLGGPQYVIQLVDGTYFPNVGLMMAEKWGDVARMVEKYMTEGASTVKEVSGVSIDKEVKQALRTFKKTFKDYEQFKDPKTGEYDISAMTEHLNSYVPGTINYAKVQMEAAKKEEKKQERKDKIMEQVRNKSMGGFLKIDGLNSYSQGGVLQDVMTYPEYSDGGEAQQSSSPIPIPIPLPSPSASAPPLPQGTPPPDVPMIMGSTDGEVMQAFLFNELGAS